MFTKVFISLCGVFLACATPVFAAEPTNGLPSPYEGYEHVRQFNVEAALNRGDDLVVTERLTYDFADQIKHGIYRYLPKFLVVGYRKISNGVHFSGAFRDGKTELYQLSTQSEQALLKIGDPEANVTGIHEYQFAYGLTRSVVDTANGQRLAWNVTGNGWTVPIWQSTFRLDAPVAPLQVTCFTGYLRETEKNCSVTVSGTQVIAQTTDVLEPNQGWTVEAIYPAGTFIPAAVDRGSLPPWLAPWVIFTVLYTGIWLALWWFFGRDTKGRGTIIAQYDPPPGTKPYLVNAMDNDGITHRGLAATILDLARRNALKLTILNEGKDFRIERLRAGERDLDTFETAVISMLFIDGDELDSFSIDPARAKIYQLARAQVNKQLQHDGYHQWNIAFIRGVAIVIAVLSWMACLVAVYLFLYDPNLWLSFIGLGIGIFLAYHMPKRTKTGAVLYEQIQGFARYIKVAEKDRLAFHEAPARTPERFSALLPFAVALGLEKAWGRVFEGIALAPGTNNSAFTSALQMSAFAHTLSNDTRSLAITNTNSGGSGGFSGGGGGGGGGGSW